MTQSRTRCIGMDVHKESIAVASVAQDHGAEVTYLGTIGTRQCDIDQLVRTIQSKAKHRLFVYEAGPWGDWRYRSLTKNGDDCWGVAPSLLPKNLAIASQPTAATPGHWPAWPASGALSAVSVPQVADAAIRDLTRAREDARSDCKDAKLRLTAFLLRHDIRSTGRATWNPAPLRWLSEVVCPTPAQHIVFQEYVRAVTEHTARLQRLDQELQARGKAWRLNPVVKALQALRGVQCTVAVTTVAARGDLTRFDPPRERMKCLGRSRGPRGLVPRRRRGQSWPVCRRVRRRGGPGRVVGGRAVGPVGPPSGRGARRPPVEAAVVPAA